jgi:hypothetical protein
MTLLKASRTALMVTLLIVAGAGLLFPALRTSATRQVVNALTFVVVCILGWRMWRSGVLTRTPQQIYEAAKERGRPRLIDLHEWAALILGTAVVTFY